MWCVQLPGRATFQEFVTLKTTSFVPGVVLPALPERDMFGTVTFPAVKVFSRCGASGSTGAQHVENDLRFQTITAL